MFWNSALTSYNLLPTTTTGFHKYTSSQKGLECLRFSSCSEIKVQDEQLAIPLEIPLTRMKSSCKLLCFSFQCSYSQSPLELRLVLACELLTKQFIFLCCFFFKKKKNNNNSGSTTAVHPAWRFTHRVCKWPTKVGAPVFFINLLASYSLVPAFC